MSPMPGVVASGRVATATTGLLNNAAILAPRNATTTHTVTPSTGTLSAGTLFTPTAGRLLLCLCYGPVTSTLPSGWTLAPNGSLVGGGGIYLWYKTAAGGDSVTTTHNSSNYTVMFQFFEFPAGTVLQDCQNNSIIATAANFTVSGLTGTTNIVMAAKGGTVSSTSGAWNLSMTESLDIVVPTSGTNGFWLGTAYRENYATATFQPTCTVTGGSGNYESLTWAVK